MQCNMEEEALAVVTSKDKDVEGINHMGVVEAAVVDVEGEVEEEVIIIPIIPLPLHGIQKHEIPK